MFIFHDVVDVFAPFGLVQPRKSDFEETTQGQLANTPRRQVVSH
jgi:hypothetical protein